MKEMLNKCGFLIVCLFVGLELVAQPCPTCPPPPPISIDSDFIVLFVVGLLFGFYKIYMFKKKRSI